LIASLLHLRASYVSKLFLGVEARGFMFGPSIALAIGAKFVLLRKPGKFPGKLKLNGASKLSFQLFVEY
jgi:adenine/guanine phosphoribosyltransferase-like PRPP-binding protein